MSTKDTIDLNDYPKTKNFWIKIYVNYGKHFYFFDEQFLSEYYQLDIHYSMDILHDSGYIEFVNYRWEFTDKFINEVLTNSD